MSERITYPLVVCAWCPPDSPTRLIATAEQEARLPAPKVSHSICADCDRTLRANLDAKNAAKRL